MDINQRLGAELSVAPKQVEAAVKLIDDGNTIPFIARYRKEQTGNLDDQLLRQLAERLHYLRGLEERKGEVLASIEKAGALTGELAPGGGEWPNTLTELEDLYRPYRPKRRTRASMAKERGLTPLADTLRSGKRPDADRRPCPGRGAGLLHRGGGAQHPRRGPAGGHGHPGGGDFRRPDHPPPAAAVFHRGGLPLLRGEGGLRRERLRKTTCPTGSRCARWRGTGCWPSTGARKRGF